MIRASLHSLVVVVLAIVVVDTLTNRMGIFVCGHGTYKFQYALVAF